MAITIKTLNRDAIQNLTGYRPFTSFYEDFSMAELGGISGVKKTFEMALNEWKNDYKYLTELVMVLNWKIWEHSESNEPMAEAYDSLWERARDFCSSTLTGKELDYYYDKTD